MIRAVLSHQTSHSITLIIPPFNNRMLQWNKRKKKKVEKVSLDNVVSGFHLGDRDISRTAHGGEVGLGEDMRTSYAKVDR